MTTHVEDVTTGVGLLIDGDVVAGGGGHLPGDEPGPAGRGRPRRPGHLPGAARPGRGRGPPVPAGVGRAGDGGAGGRRSSPRPRPGVAAVEAGDLARLLTREHGKTHLEAVFDTATMAGMAAAFAPLVAEALAAARGERRGDPDRVGAPRGGGRHPPLQLARLGHGQQGAAGAAGRGHGRGQGAAARARGRCCWSPPPWPRCCPPGVLNVVNGPDAALGAALVGHPGVDMVSFTGGVRHRAGGHGRGGRHDPPGRARAGRQRRRHPRPRRRRRRARWPTASSRRPS